MRALVMPLVAAILLSGCAREPREEAPAIVAIKATGADLSRFQAAAAKCGAGKARVETINNATFLIVGTENSLAARDCFFERARADYRAHHPVRAWIEGLIG